MGRLCDYQGWNAEINTCYTCDTSLLYTINKPTFSCNHEGFLYN